MQTPCRFDTPKDRYRIPAGAESQAGCQKTWVVHRIRKTPYPLPKSWDDNHPTHKYTDHRPNTDTARRAHMEDRNHAQLGMLFGLAVGGGLSIPLFPSESDQDGTRLADAIH